MWPVDSSQSGTLEVAELSIRLGLCWRSGLVNPLTLSDILEMWKRRCLRPMPLSHLQLSPKSLCCPAIDCGPPVVVNNAVLSSMKSTTYNSSVTFQCLSGYWFYRGVYDITSTCHADGLWTTLDVACKCSCASCYYIDYGQLVQILSLFLNKCSKWDIKRWK